MVLHLDTGSEIPIYVQVRNQIVLGIGRGELSAGESLPTVRQLAEDIGINPMTVSKAYAALKAEGYLEIDRRHGAKVSRKAVFSGAFHKKLEGELELLIAESKAHGMERDSFLTLCADLFSRMSSPAQEGN